VKFLTPVQAKIENEKNETTKLNLMNPNTPAPVPSLRNAPGWRRTIRRQLPPLVAGSALAVAPQTPVLAQVATNMVDFYVSGGLTVTGPAAVGSPGDYWNPVSGCWFCTPGASDGCLDVLGNSVNDNISITFCGGDFGPDHYGPATLHFGECLLDLCRRQRALDHQKAMKSSL
jgi:hypothetical protein